MSVQGIGLSKLLSQNLANINMGNKRAHTITVDFKHIDESFVGNVVVHYPSQIEKMQMGVIKSSMLGSMDVDVTTNNIAHILSTLEMVIDSKPEWLNADDPRVEYEIFEEIYLQYHEWCNTFRRKSE